MSQQIQELIDKIKSEGIQTAEEQAKNIESQAQKKADEIMAQAHKEAETILTQAKEEVKRTQESTHRALEQVARDMLLSLHQNIANTLEHVTAQEVKDALTPEKTGAIIEKMVTTSAQSDNILVTLNDKDLKDLQDGIIAKLQKRLKGNITFQGSEAIGKGFTISYDTGKSSFDFTDENLAQYLTTFLNEKVSQILKSATAT